MFYPLFQLVCIKSIIVKRHSFANIFKIFSLRHSMKFYSYKKNSEIYCAPAAIGINLSLEYDLSKFIRIINEKWNWNVNLFLYFQVFSMELFMMLMNFRLNIKELNKNSVKRNLRKRLKLENF